MKLNSVFTTSKPIIGVVHLLPLPGSPKYAGDFGAIFDGALDEVQILSKGGVSGIIIENFNDNPFSINEITKEQLSLMASLMTLARKEVNIPLGVNVHFNDWKSEIALAFSCKAQFVRIEVFVDTVMTASGIVEPCCAEACRYRKLLDASGSINIWADIHPKYSRNLLPTTLEESAKMAKNALADSIIVTGETTGAETPLRDIQEVKNVVDLPVIVGSGVNAENVNQTLAIADGAIVGSAFKTDDNVNNKVSPEKIETFFRAINL